MNCYGCTNELGTLDTSGYCPACLAKMECSVGTYAKGYSAGIRRMNILTAEIERLRLLILSGPLPHDGTIAYLLESAETLTKSAEVLCRARMRNDEPNAPDQARALPSPEAGCSAPLCKCGHALDDHLNSVGVCSKCDCQGWMPSTPGGAALPATIEGGQ